jgi:hypothetical protein
VSTAASTLPRGRTAAAAVQDYDDAYIIEYARQARGCVVSNDMYRDFIGAAEVLTGVLNGVLNGVL